MVGQRVGLTFPLPKTRPPQIPPPPNPDFCLSEPETPDRGLVSLPLGRGRFRMVPRRDSRRNESGSKAGLFARRGRVGRGAHSRGLPRWVSASPRVAAGHIPSALGRLLLPVLLLCGFSSLSACLPCRAAVALPPPGDASSAPALPGSATTLPEGGEGAGNGDPPHALIHRHSDCRLSGKSILCS